MSGELIREDPPTVNSLSGRPLGPFSLWLTTISAHPGEWFRYPEPHDQGNARNVIYRGNSAVSPGDYELRAAKVPGTTKSTLWARYVGGEA